MPFTNVIEWVELDAPSRALMKIHGETSGSVVDIKGELILSGNADDTTDLNWSAEVVVMGTIASLASRLMGSTTKKLSNEFFECAKNKIEV